MGAMLLAALFSMATSQTERLTKGEGGGYIDSETGGLVFVMPPCRLSVQSPAAAHRMHRKRAEERFEDFKGARPTEYNVSSACYTDKFTDKARSIEKIVAIVDGNPRSVAEFYVKKTSQQNAYGATRTVEDAGGTLPPHLFEPGDKPLTIVLVTSGGRVYFILLPADLRYLHAER